MRIEHSLAAVVISVIGVWACDSGDSSEDAAAGAMGVPSPAGTAGAAPSGASGAPPVAAAGAASASAGARPAAGGNASTTGGAGTTGAAGTPGVRLGTGGPFAFPQNKKPGMCSLTTATNASESARSAYNYWKSAFVTSNGAGNGLRVQRGNGDGNDTVSEGIGYGMIAAVYMNDRPTFDGLWAYAKSHFDAQGLMSWHISAGGTPIGADGMGSATDADEDIAWALLMASNQWSSATYLADAKATINAMYATEIAPDGTLKPGDNWGGTALTFPDYFSPAYLRVFAKATNNPNWSGIIIDRNYEIINKVQGTHGLVPDKTSTSAYEISSNYSYDACRTPWRIGMDYCFNAEPRAQAYLTKIGAFFNGIGASNIVDGYQNSGSQAGNAKNMAFIGPAGVAGMMGYQSLLDGAFAFGASNQGDNNYYAQSLRVITMLMMSGNFVDFSKI